jgi:hypothetical protein
MRYQIVNKRTGKKHAPKRRGFRGHDYPNAYAAMCALDAMPRAWANAYEIRAAVRQGVER